MNLEKRRIREYTAGMKKYILFAIILLIIITIIYFGFGLISGGLKDSGLADSAEAEIKNLLGNPGDFSISYVPQGSDEAGVLARNEIWFYPEQGLKVVFIGGSLVGVEEYMPISSTTSATELNPEDFYFDITREELDGIFGAENIEPVDYLPGLYEEGVFETYLTDKAIFVLEQGKLTFIQTFGLGGDKVVIKDGRMAGLLNAALGVSEAEARINLKKAFKCLGKVCKFVVDLPDKVTKPLGPVVGPIVSTILTQNIAKHKNLGRIFSKAKKIDDVFKTVEEQKQIVAEVQKMYTDAAEEMKKKAAEIRESRNEMLGQLTEGGYTYEDYKEHVLALETLAASFDAAADKFSKESAKITLENVVKMAGKNLVNKVFGQAREIVMNNVGRELVKLVNPDILESLISQNENGADAILDMLVGGDLARVLKGGDTTGIDLDELKKRIRDEIKVMLKESKEDLRKNWKTKIAEILDKKVAELKEEKEKKTKEAEEAVSGQEKGDGKVAAPAKFYKDPSGNCKSGYKYTPQGGITCIQENCYPEAIPNAHWSYEGYCVCGTSGSIAEKPTDPNKECAYPGDYESCPGCVYACVTLDKECSVVKGD